MLYLFVWKWQVAVSNSSRVDLHKNPIGKVGFLIFFQTPAEEIYTLSVISLYFEKSVFKLQRRKFTLILCVFIGGAALFSNSSGGNLHDYRPEETAVKENEFSNSSGGNLHAAVFADSGKHVAFSNSSGGNLHDLEQALASLKALFKLQRRKFTLNSLFILSRARNFQTPAEEIYTAPEILFFQAMNI